MANLLRLCAILAGVSQLNGWKLSDSALQNASVSIPGLSSSSLPIDMHPSKTDVQELKSNSVSVKNGMARMEMQASPNPSKTDVQELNSNSVSVKSSKARMKMQETAVRTSLAECAYTPVTIPFFVTPLLIVGLLVLASLQLFYGNGVRGFVIVAVYLIALSLISVIMKKALEELAYPVSISLLHKLCTAITSMAVERPQVDVALVVMQLSLLASASQILGNIALSHGSVAVVMAIGACNPVVTLLLQAARGKEAFTTASMVTVSFVALGTALCISGELHLSLICVAVASVSTLFRSVSKITMQQLMQQDGGVSPMQLNFWSSAWAFLLCISFLPFGEGVGFIAAFQHSTTRGRQTVFLSVICAVVLNSFGFLALKLLGATTQGMVSNLSLIVTMLLGSVLIHEEITILQLLGSVLAPVGLVINMQLQETAAEQATK